MAEKQKPGDVVKYVGIADEVTITEAQWTGAGAGGQGKVVWDSSNGLQVPVEDLSAEALAVLEKDSDRFKKVQVKKD